MKKTSVTVSSKIEMLHQEKLDLSKYEVSFRRWLVCQIDSGNLSYEEAIRQLKLPSYFKPIFQSWQAKYSEDYRVSLSMLNSKERTDNKKLQERIVELEKQLEMANMRNTALNTVIDIAEDQLKLSIRKKSGAKQ